ncbi:GNAT family N-acetyltransferase [Desulfitobacterium sp. PCE1]|uniref:GNAT family N-acetyltransferase n=1 Tax=Desulfitobacterium sp. PCE1 TaxID=146907 RepID=UPI00210FDB9B|nr:GNAT family N-acetyltransferase [Desulfitobacterium sp. PCE1]
MAFIYSIARKSINQTSGGGCTKEKVNGYARLNYEGKEAILSQIVVDEEYRNQGLESELVKRAAIGDDCWNKTKRGTLYVGSNCEAV